MLRIFDPHVHMYARTTDDYEIMALAGIERIVEPAFWLGQPRKRPGTFFDYFEHLLEFETERAAQYGIDHWVTIAMNPREANDEELCRAVLAELPRYLDHPRCVAVGEIGFDRITEAEERALRAQLEMARERGLPVLIHTPHHRKKEGTERTLAVLRDMDYDMDMVLMDHNTEETIGLSQRAGCWCGHTVYPITKLSPERATAILQQYGTRRMLINSAADWGPSDPLSVPKTVREMRRRGFTDEQIAEVVWDNPHRFFARGGLAV
ncbi:MAG: TatD family hydrolase [Planctomycetota bacterium]|nr:MAG: TatD family hydrolase [Planctomycetota bacterium]